MVAVKLRGRPQPLEFSSGGLLLRRGDEVMVETAEGLEMGRVCLVRRAEPGKELPPVRRRATPRDRGREKRAREKEKEALRLCREKVRRMGLEMDPVEARYYQEGRVVIYFLAEKRVDFRRLVQELARELRSRVEMRQVGVRDRSRFLGGVGPCGRELCCSSFLSRFEPVSIRLAKAQGLSLSPTRVSGVCGRLMCCLRYEVHEGECSGCRGLGGERSTYAPAP